MSLSQLLAILIMTALGTCALLASILATCPVYHNRLALTVLIILDELYK